MISKDYCLQMARHNKWQNEEMAQAFSSLDANDLVVDRGAFFGSILATANHLMWGDLTWLSRFDGQDGPVVGLPESSSLTDSYDAWYPLRQQLDARFINWAESVQQSDLEGIFEWYSGAMQRDFKVLKATCICQMFNHQTHHRGQIHAMVTAAGGRGWTTDLPFIPASYTES